MLDVLSSVMLRLSLSFKSEEFRYEIRRSTSDFVINPHWSAEDGIMQPLFSEASCEGVHGAQCICISSQAKHILLTNKYEIIDIKLNIRTSLL